jgi:hypothetical protein
MWSGMDLAGNFCDKFEVKYQLDQMIEDAFMTNFEVIFG